MFNAIIVGLGKQAHKHADGLVKSGFRLVAGIDPDQDARKRFAKKYSCEAFPSCEKDDLPVGSDANIGIICTPLFARKQAIEELISHGIKTFVVEKPLALTLADCAFFEKIEQNSDVKFYVNYTYRLTPPYYELKLALVENDTYFSCGRFYLGAPGNHKPWKHQKHTSGGAYNELGVHMRDLANFLLGPPSETFPKNEVLVHSSREFDGKRQNVDAPDLYTQAFKHEGTISLIMSDFLSPKFTNTVVLTNSELSLELEIGKVLPETSDIFPISTHSDKFGSDSYQRLYSLLLNGDPDGILHTPADTLNLLSECT